MTILIFLGALVGCMIIGMPISFASHHMGKHPFEVIDLYGHEQVLWPDHCVSYNFV